MAVITADGASVSRGRRFSWTGSYDTTTKDLVYEAKLLDYATGAPLTPLPGEDGGAELMQTNGQTRRIDPFELGIVNAGPQTYTNVNLKVDTVGRWTGFELRTWYTAPPVG